MYDKKKVTLNINEAAPDRVLWLKALEQEQLEPRTCYV